MHIEQTYDQTLPETYLLRYLLHFQVPLSGESMELVRSKYIPGKKLIF